MIVDSLSDESIIRKILLGETALFKLIVERYQQRIFRMGMRFFKNQDEAMDFTQDTLILCYRKLDTYRGLSPFKYWILKVAYNAGINKLKSTVIDTSLPEQNEPVDISMKDPQKEYAASESRRIIHEAINTLPEKYRLCITMFFFDGLKFREISKITGYPVNTIKSHVSRAKQQLRAYLKGADMEETDEM